MRPLYCYTLSSVLLGCFVQISNSALPPSPVQDELPKITEQRDKFSSLFLKFQPVPALPSLQQTQLVNPEEPGAGAKDSKSLWEVLRENFNQGLASSPSSSNNKPVENIIENPIIKNLVAASSSSSITRLSSAFEWASKLKPLEADANAGGSDGNRTARDASTALVLDTVKLMSSVVGRGFLSNWIAHNPALVKSFSLGLNSLSPKSDGWGWSKPVAYVREKSLLERFLTAKFTIIRYLVLLKFQLQKQLLLSTLPAAIQVKLTAVNFLLKLLSSKDVRKTWWYVRYLLNALVKGHLSLLRGVVSALELKYPGLKGYGVPDVSYGSPWDAWKIKETPATKYGTPADASYGIPSLGKLRVPEAPGNNYGIPEVSYGAEKPTSYIPESSYDTPKQPSYGLRDNVHVSTPEISYGTPSDTHTPLTLSNPLYAFPTFSDGSVVQSLSNGDYSAPGPNLPTLPPIHIPEGSNVVSTGDGVLVSGNFLRNFIASQSRIVSNKVTKPAGFDGESHAKSTRSNEASKPKEKKPGFSSQLLLSGFGRQ